MRLLYVLHRSPNEVPAGTELHTLDLVGNLGPEFETFLFYPEGGSVWLRGVGSQVIASESYDRPASPFFERIPEVERFFAAAIKEHGIDLVHFQHFLNLPTSLAAITVEHDLPYIVTVHDYYFWCVNYNLLRDLQFCGFESDLAVCQQCLARLGILVESSLISGHRQRMLSVLRSAATIVCPSESARRSLLSVHPELSTSTVHVIEHGSPAAILPAAKPRRAGPLRIAFLGAVVPSKGSHYFVALVEAFRNRSEVKFFAIGVNWFGPEDPIWFIPNIRWLETYERGELGRILHHNAIDLVLLLSPWAETFSYTLSEAILTATPVIATDLGALRERVTRFGIGFLVEAEDPVPRLIRLLDDIISYPGMLDLFKPRCLAAAEHLNTVTDMANQYSELYRQVANLRRI